MKFSLELSSDTLSSFIVSVPSLPKQWTALQVRQYVTLYFCKTIIHAFCFTHTIRANTVSCVAIVR